MSVSYRCPLCQQLLQLQQRSYRCSQNHCFDLAKEGYVNLLPAQNKRSKTPGDSDDMLKARRRFLNGGYFQPLVDGLAQHLQQIAKDDSLASMLDMGCGEGYYLRALQQACPQSLSPSVCGVDIAKTGVKMAAKSQPDGQFSVASAASLPFFDNEFDGVVSVFAPVFMEECLRVLKPSGYLLMVGPGPDHLKQLAARLYDKVEPHKGNFQALEESSDLQLVNEQRIQATITVEGQALQDLLMMTPYYWHTSAERQQQLAQGSAFTTTIDFVLRCYQHSTN